VPALLLRLPLRALLGAIMKAAALMLQFAFCTIATIAEVLPYICVCIEMYLCTNKHVFIDVYLYVPISLYIYTYIFVYLAIYRYIGKTIIYIYGCRSKCLPVSVPIDIYLSIFMHI
jgi:hypothetical protein